jgi:hypothetical protein
MSRRRAEQKRRQVHESSTHTFPYTALCPSIFVTSLADAASSFAAASALFADSVLALVLILVAAFLVVFDAPALPLVPRKVGSLKSPWSNGIRLM